jgi:GntR family transcriptional regulator/MocR family aminotransferase
VTRWQLTLSVDRRDARTPIFVRISRAISADIRRGRLVPGAALPGQRSLAKTLGVDRETVAAAYGELKAQGWIVVRPAKGAFVTEAFPDVTPARAARERVVRARGPAFAFEVAATPALIPEPRRAFDLSRSAPDPREFPTAEFTRALRRQLVRSGSSLLGYGDARGHPGLRSAIATMLTMRRGLAVSADEVVVVRGSQMGLELVARALVGPGDTVAVENPGYPSAWAAFEGAGARLLALPVDDSGLDVASLERAASAHRVRAVYVTPHHQYPTTVTLAPARRMALLDVARRHRIAVIEDDYDHEYHYEGRPILPLASIDDGGSVIYVGTLSKTLAPTLRIGYVAAPRPVVETLAAVRQRIDRQGDLATEAAVADLMEEGVVQRHAWRMQRLCRVRRDAFVEAVRTKLGERLELNTPPGGMAVWTRVLSGLDVEAWARRCRTRDVILQTGRKFTRDLRPIPYLRLNFAALREHELEEAVRRMAASV